MLLPVVAEEAFGTNAIPLAWRNSGLPQQWLAATVAWRNSRRCS